jgi:hypothetical protein
MNKVYIIVPAILLGIFAFFYSGAVKEMKAKETAIKQEAEQKRKDKAAREIENREKAMKEAIETSARRKVEREAREAVEEAKKTARQEAEDARIRANEDRNKFRDQVARLKKDLEEVKAVTAKVADEKKRNLDEQTHLKDYVKQAEANVKYYYDLLDKIAAAEAAKAKAAAEAASSKKG